MNSIDIDSKWNGLYVYNELKNKPQSYINHLEIQNVGQTKVGVLNLTGGVTFYKSKLNINNLFISNAFAEDALNIIKSNVKIKNLNINNSLSDGLDCDFCKGQIEEVFLNNIGGDGIDFSGSDVKLAINKANQISDKVVSIGEESEIKLFLSNASKSFLAAAIKDGSKASIILKNIDTFGPEVMAYNKKGYFQNKTRADIFIHSNNKKINLNNFLTTKEAELVVNGEIILPKNIDIKSLYQFGPMKKNK